MVFSADDCDVEQALTRGRGVLKDLLRALRLFGDGRVTLGALAWARVGAGAWNPLALGAGGRPHGMLVVSAEQEDELRGVLQPRLPPRARTATSCPGRCGASSSAASASCL